MQIVEGEGSITRGLRKASAAGMAGNSRDASVRGASTPARGLFSFRPKCTHFVSRACAGHVSLAENTNVVSADACVNRTHVWIILRC